MRLTLIALLAAALLPALAAAPARAACSDVDLLAELPDSDRAALLAEAETRPYPEGLLWRATKEGREITMFGTYHLAHPQLEAHLERLRPIIAGADRVYLEMSRDDTALLKRMMAEQPELMFITEGPTLPDLLGEADWKLLSEAFAERGIPAILGSRFKPIYASSLLAISPCAMREGAADAGIDQRIAEAASAAGVPDLSLEEVTVALSLLDGFSREQQIDMLRLSFKSDADPDALSNTLMQAYLREEVALIWAFFRAQSLEEGGETAARDMEQFESVLLTGRNRAWVEVLDAPEAGERLLAAFGAAHLPGEDGMLRLLEARGYSIERLPLTAP